MRPTRSQKSHITALLWLSLSQSVLGMEDTTSPARRSFVNGDRDLHTLSKRAGSSKTTYIAVVVGVVGTLAIVSAGVCWDLHRRRRRSRQRQMEEARHPREPISYDHFPVESEPGAETGSPRVAVNASGINSPPTMTMSAASHLAPLTIQGGSRLTSPPGLELSPPPIAHTRASHPRDHLTSQSTQPGGLSSSQRQPESTPQYEEDAGLHPPPPFFDGDDAAPGHRPPPGLEGPNGRVHSNPNSSSSSRPTLLLTPPPSRPPTASAPPAYTPSDSEAHNTSSRSNNSARSTPPQ